MTGTEVDFKVKKGLKVQGGNVDFSNSQNATIAVDALTVGTSNTVGKNLTISSGTGTGNALGGKLIFKTGGPVGDSGTTATTAVQALTIQPGGTVHIGTTGASSTVTSTGSTIDAATIGSNSHASGKFTTLQATSTSTLTLANTDLVTVNGTDRSQMTLLQANGTAGAGGSNNITTDERNYAEIRIRQKMGDGNIQHSQVEYMGGAYIIENNTLGATGTGQGVVFTVGNSGSSGSNAWAIGRQATTGKFAIGYSGKDYDNVKDSVGNPMRTGQEYLVLDVSGNLALTVPNTTFTFTSNASSGATEYTTAFKGSASATGNATYTLPPAHAAGNDYVLTAQTNGTLAWAASASGADGMGAGFQLEDDDGTELAITTSKEVKFIGEGITTNWTASDGDGSTTHGGDSDPYDMTFTLDINDLTEAAIASGDFIAFSDEGAAGDPTKKESIDDVAALFAGTGLSASSAVLSVDAAQTQITSVGTLSSLTVGATSSEGAVDINATTFDVDATGAATIDSAGFAVTSSDTTNITLAANQSSQVALTIDAANAGLGAALISIGTTGGTAVNIGHGTSEVTFGDNVTITGNLTVNGAQTIIDSTTVVSEDKTFILGLTGGMTDATYGRSGTTVTVTSSSHGFSSTEYILVQDAGNSITDNVYQITVTNVNTFTFTSPASGTVSAGATMLHSTNNTTEAIADGAGIYAPGTSLHSLQYDSSNGWTVSDDLEIATGKHISIAGNTTLDATSLGLYGNSTMNANVLTFNTLGSTVVSSSLTGVGVLDGGSITSGFGTINTGESTITTTGLISGGSLDIDDVLIDGTTIGHTDDTDLITLADGLVTVAGEISVTTLDIGGTNVTSNAGELNLLDDSSAGTVVNSKAVIYSSAGQVKANTLSVDAIAVIDTSTATNQSWNAGTAYNIATYAYGSFRTAKFIVQVSDGTDFDVGEILVTWKGGSNPSNHSAIYLTTYAYMSTKATDLGTIDADLDVSGENIELRFTPATNGTYAYDIVNTVLVK